MSLRANIATVYSCAFFLLGPTGHVHGAGGEIVTRSSKVALVGSSNSIADESRNRAEQIDQLIEALGSDQYAQRQRAEMELVQLGADAFDQLKSIENHPDLEIATRISYILQRIKIEWTHQDDPPAVRKLMARYGEISKSDRLERIQRLAAIDDEQGLGPICRIARFDPSPLLSRYAALTILRVELPPTDQTETVVETINRELDGSSRATASWIRNYLIQQHEPEQSADRWIALIDSEMRLFEQGSSETGADVVLELLRHDLDLCGTLQRTDDVVELLERIIGMHVQADEATDRGLEFALDWIWQAERWRVLEVLEAKYGETILARRPLLYRYAAIQSKRGRDGQATELADRAYQLEGADDENRNGLAYVLVKLDHFDWAEREWRYVIERFPAISEEAINARDSLSMWLHDRLRHLEAAQVLSEMEAEIAEDLQKNKRNVRQRNKLQIVMRQFNSRKEYYFACHAESQGDFATQRTHLDKAIEYYEIDADVLIAMYRLQGADQEYQRKTMEHINHVCTLLLQQIDKSPNSAIFCNHFAWLVANTEGDFKKALDFSRRSLELRPDEASYLDTLARCYFANDDLINALKNQRKALKLEPYVQALHRQLEFFEQELENRKSEESNAVTRSENG